MCSGLYNVQCHHFLPGDNLLHSFNLPYFTVLFWMQPLDESGYWEVNFGTPDYFMRCSVEGKSHNQSCLFRIPDIDGSDSTLGTVVWKIPSGMKAHAGIVSVVTFVAALISAILIAVTSIFYSDNSIKHSKES